MQVTGESLSKGHREALKDMISLNLLRSCLKNDINSWLNFDVLVTEKAVIVAGAINSNTNLDVYKIVQKLLKSYKHYQRTTVVNLLKSVSNVKKEYKVSGYSKKSLLKLENLANLVSRKLVERAKLLNDYSEFETKNDLKAKVTIDYLEDKPVVRCVQMYIDNLNGDDDKFYDYVIDEIIEPIITFYDLKPEKYEIRINDVERFIRGDLNMRVGVCGYTLSYEDEFIGVDEKEMTNIERVAEAMARFLAMEIINKEFADECYIELNYGDNVDGPEHIKVETFNTNRVDEKKIYSFIENHDLSINGIIDLLDIKLK